MKRVVFASGALVLAAMVVSRVFAMGVWANRVVYLRGDAATLTLLLGSIVAASVAAIGWWRINTHQRQTAQITQLQHDAAAERRRFLGRLDHELKNPLTAIHAGLANLADAVPHPAVNTIKTQTVRLSRLVADLRKFAELETMEIEHEPVELAAVLEDVYQAILERPQSAQRRITCTLPQTPWPLSLVRGDADLLFLAFYNLLDNALKFSNADDRIELRASEHDGTITVDVADTGMGIAPEDINEIWEELFRGKTARGVAGSGLGLSLTRAIVLRHHGAVQVRSRVGQGTVVSVRLPSLVTKS